MVFLWARMYDKADVEARIASLRGEVRDLLHEIIYHTF